MEKSWSLRRTEAEKATLGLEEMAGRNGKNREVGLGKKTTLPPLHTAANSATVYYPNFTWYKEDKSSCRESSKIIPIPPVRHPAQSNWAPQGCLGAGHAHCVCRAPSSLRQCRAVCAVTFPTKYTQPCICTCTLHSFLASSQNSWVPARVQALLELETVQGQRQKHLCRLLTVHQAASWAECPCSLYKDSD